MKKGETSEFFKNCPECNDIIYFSSKYNLRNSISKNSMCHTCKCIGNKNPFFGKKHTKETLEKIASSRAMTGYDMYKTPEYRAKISEISKNSKGKWMHKMSFYEKWIEMHGEDIANQKMIEHRAKQSLNNSGSKNSMYGKTSPKKSGNGWKGWYKGHFFRSLRELGYIVYELELKLIDWKSAENIRIPYIHYNGNNRTYSPDFFIGNKLIEIKPEKLINTPLVKLKTEAAIKYCKENNLEFEILDYKIIDIKDLELLINNNKVILTDSTKIKLEEWKIKNV